jgi:ribosomal protein S27AE
MIACKGCGGPVSKEAAACPKCGQPTAAAKRNDRIYLGCMFVLIVVFAFFYWASTWTVR